MGGGRVSCGATVRRGALTFLIFLGLESAGAFAQITEPQAPGTGVPETPPSLPEKPAPKYDFRHNITGDWFGWRNRLSDEGIDITGGYATEFLGNPVGGRQQGQTYVHNILVQGDADLEKLIGLPDSAFRVRFSQRSGDSLSKQKIGNAFSVQQLYGGGQTYRLVEMQMYHSLFDDTLNLTYGRLSATDDFLTSPLYCQFVSNAICGQPAAPFFNMPSGITAYPGATWGARARYTFPFETYWMVGVYDGDPDKGDPLLGEHGNEHGTDFSFGGNGVLVLTEAGYTPHEGLLGLPGHYKVGGYYHSGDFHDVSRDVNGNNRFATGLPGRSFSGNSGYYTLLDQMLYREKPEADQGLYSLFVFILAPDQRHNQFPCFMSAGLIYQGLLDFRPDDKTTLGVANGWFSDKIGNAEHGAGQRKQSAETVLELNHQIQITPAVYVRPDLQYVIKPNGYSNIDNALVLGFEAGITF
jgi:porin